MAAGAIPLDARSVKSSASTRTIPQAPPKEAKQADAPPSTTDSGASVSIPSDLPCILPWPFATGIERGSSQNSPSGGGSLAQAPAPVPLLEKAALGSQAADLCRYLAYLTQTVADHGD